MDEGALEDEAAAADTVAMLRVVLLAVDACVLDIVEPTATAGLPLLVAVVVVLTAGTTVVAVVAVDGRRFNTLVVGKPVGGNILSMPTDKLPVGSGYVSASPRSDEGIAKLPWLSNAPFNAS